MNILVTYIRRSQLKISGKPKTILPPNEEGKLVPSTESLISYYLGVVGNKKDALRLAKRKRKQLIDDTRKLHKHEIDE